MTNEVRALVASFLVADEDLIDAQLYHPDTWVGVLPSDKNNVLSLLTLAPISAFRKLIGLFAHCHTEVAQSKGRRGLQLDENEDKRAWFLGVCEGGHTHLIDECKFFTFDPEGRMRALEFLKFDLQDPVEFIDLAARYGHVRVLAKLLQKLDGKEHEFALMSLIVETASEYGHVEILEEVRRNWGATKEHAYDGVPAAARNGHTPVLVELRENWKCRKDDNRTDMNSAFISAVRNDHADVIREFRTNWHMVMGDVSVTFYADTNHMFSNISDTFTILTPNEAAEIVVCDGLSNATKTELKLWGFNVEWPTKRLQDRVQRVLCTKRRKQYR